MPDDRWIVDQHFEPKGADNVVALPVQSDAAAPAALEFLAFDGWDDSEPPDREWAVDHMMPLRNVTLLSGEGAIGKSILMMQLCAAHALGKDWIQQLPMPGHAIYLGAEDDEDELHRRFAHIAKHYGSKFADLSQLHIASRAGRDAVLGAADRAGVVRPTMLFQQLLAAVIALQPRLIALDTAADVFAGNENDRAQVRQFIGLLRALAIAGRSAVLLASHPSLQGLHTESGLSGSTAWHNSVRSRLFLKNAPTDGDAAADSGLRILEMKKSNYGPHAKQIALRWDAGVFKPVDDFKNEMARAKANEDDERVFLTLLARFNTSNRNVSDKGGKSFAPVQFAKEPEGEKVGVKALDAAMRRLFSKNKISLIQYGRPSNPHFKIASMELPL